MYTSYAAAPNRRGGEGEREVPMAATTTATASPSADAAMAQKQPSAAKPLESGAVSAFCEGVAMMLAAGIQTDEAVGLLGENMKPSPFKQTCDEVYRALIGGASFAEALRASGRFPARAVSIVVSGEESGRLENVLRSLAVQYGEEERLFVKMRSGIVYPAALLAVMTVILAFTVAVILPVFIDVYENLSGNVAAGAFAYVNVSVGIGWVALVVMALVTLLAIVVAVVSRGSGRGRVVSAFSRLPLTRDAMYRLGLSRFASSLATYISAGFDTNTAMERSAAAVDHPRLRARLDQAIADMTSANNPKSLSQAIYDNEVFDPLYARMLMVGSRSGSVEDVLQRLSDAFFEDAVARMDDLIDGVEPVLAAFLTVSVGATLVAVMLPLIGIMGAIG